MNDTAFKPVKSLKAIAKTASLAGEIWREHYIPIIGKPQVDYMLAKFQSKTAIAEQIKSGGRYYLIMAEGKGAAGYLAVEPLENELYLSKFYILARYRGRGLGRKAVAFMKELAKDSGLCKISVSVNKNNLNSISAYKKFGFKIKDKTVRSIGNGFVMDDYRMEMKL
jgi:ribosomal protein S18 acetylase RimI-like enzyme